MLDPTHLLELVKQALELNLDADQRLERIVSYSEALEELIKGGSIEQLDPAMLQQLAALHAQAMELAKSSLADTGMELKSLRSRAKGFLAYKDVFQKAPRMMRPRKG